MSPRMKMRGALIGAVVALTFALSWSLARVPTLEDQAAKSDAKADQALSSVATVTEEVAANKEALADANRRLVALGKAPVPVPPASAPTPVQVDEFTAEEAAAVRLVVADQLSRQKVTLTQAEITQITKAAATLAAQQIPKPADGKTPTSSELQLYVRTAVAAYCTEDKCVKQGQQGKTGEPGKDAPKVTDEELLKAAQQALASYCAQETRPCNPKDGADGKPGADGKDGRGIADTDCQDDGTWLINYTDGTTATTRGPCRVVIAPTPEAKSGS